MNYHQINQNILHQLSVLRTHPKSIIAGELTYAALSVYLNGYMDALGSCAGVNLKLEITHWFQRGREQKSAIFWTDHIPHCHPEQSEQEHIAILLNVTEAFFLENPEWHR